MEYGACKRQKWRRAPSSISLACAECKGLVTPCIICAHPIPFVGDSIWKDCSHCGAVNPMCELERHFLGLPPPLALTLSMVRRVMVAHVGRRRYTVALHSQYNQLRRVNEGTGCSNPNRDGLSEEKLEKSETVLKAMADTILCDLPFVDCEGILPLPVVKGELNQVEAVEAEETPEGEPLLKRMRMTSDNQGLDRHDVDGGNSRSAESILQKFNPLAKLSESMCGEDFASRKADISRSSYELKSKDLGRNGCSKCRSPLTKINKDSLVAEGSLMHIETQLLALHSAEALSSDLHSSTSIYPICSSVDVSAVKGVGPKTCVNQHNSLCGTRQQFGRFSIDILRLAHSALASDWEKWLAHSKLNTKGKLINEVLSCTELFLQKRQAIFHAQRLMSMASAAQAQSNVDSRALLEHQVYISAGSLLKDIFRERFKERFAAWKKLIHPFAELLDQINVILKFCFTQLGILFKDPSVPCSLQYKSQTTLNGANGETETVSEAVRAALPLWLLLYHDVAHATILGQDKSPANE